MSPGDLGLWIPFTYLCLCFGTTYFSEPFIHSRLHSSSVAPCSTYVVLSDVNFMPSTKKIRFRIPPPSILDHRAVHLDGGTAVDPCGEETGSLPLSARLANQRRCAMLHRFIHHCMMELCRDPPGPDEGVP